jgi:hypothetical protein
MTPHRVICPTRSLLLGDAVSGRHDDTLTVDQADHHQRGTRQQEHLHRHWKPLHDQRSGQRHVGDQKTHFPAAQSHRKVADIDVDEQADETDVARKRRRGGRSGDAHARERPHP